MRRGTTVGLAVAIAVVGTALVAAAAPQAQTDISGVWTVSLEMADTKAALDATVKQAGAKLQVTLVTPTGTFELAGTMIKNELSVNHTVQIQGATGEIKMTGTLVDDRIAGAINFLGSGQLKWSAVRKREAAAPGSTTPPEPAPARAPVPAPAPAPAPAPRQR